MKMAYSALQLFRPMDRVYLFEPLALEYLGAGAKLDGHEVRLLDARIDRDFERAFLDFRPRVVGITGFTSQVNIVKEIAARLKRIEPDVNVVVGDIMPRFGRPISMNRAW